VSEAARSAAFAISSIVLREASSSARASSSSLQPTIGVSRLLKSCAIPPASWPIASSRCALRRRASLSASAASA
jgi:hypothetical protein